MNIISVEVERLLSSSRVIEEKNEELKRLTNELYQKVDSLQTVWTGKDNIAFSNKIKEFQNFINGLSLVLNQYSDFLRNSANGYNQTQEEVYSEVMRLRS